MAKKSSHVFFFSITIVVLLVLFYTLTGEQAQSDYVSEVLKFREEKNDTFRTGEDSPLTRNQRQTFDSLNYFPVDPAYRVEAELEFFSVKQVMNIPTTNGKNRQYEKYAMAKFRLNGRECSVLLLKPVDRLSRLVNDKLLFLPFTDRTSGYETYEAGRYLDLEKPSTNRIVIDFNRAYNPYCAYNSTYDCPIPPSENLLDVAVEAGEKKFTNLQKD